MSRRSINPAHLAHLALELAHAQGFDLAAVLPFGLDGPERTSAAPAGHETVWTPSAASYYCSWLAQGFHGEMAYMARPGAVTSRLQPATLLPDTRSCLVVAMNYHTPLLPLPLRDDPSVGVIAAYARGVDYHATVRHKLNSLARALSVEAAVAFKWKACVDTGPILERDLAVQAGLGFFGNNTCLINPRVGSWLFLGELLLTLELPPVSSVWGRVQSSVAGASRPACGRCRRCMQACPTGALVAPHLLDARRCISYLTIESKGPVPRELRPLLGNRIFGCDICQDVCPWNKRFARPTSEAAFLPRDGIAAPKLLDLLALDEERFSQRFERSPVQRIKRMGLLRNVAVALGNWGDPKAVPLLARAMCDPDALVRGHVAWALGRTHAPEARRALDLALPREGNPWVKDEIDSALTAA